LFNNVRRRIAKDGDGVVTLKKQVKYVLEDYNTLLQDLDTEVFTKQELLNTCLTVTEDPADSLRTLVKGEMERAVMRINGIKDD